MPFPLYCNITKLSNNHEYNTLDLIINGVIVRCKLVNVFGRLTCKIYTEFAKRKLKNNQLYSVMQSYENSFCGGVVLDSYNVAYSDEDSI